MIGGRLENDAELDLGRVKTLILNEERRFRTTIYWNRLWDALKHNTTLKALHTGHCYGHENLNPIDDGHCIGLAEALKENHTLDLLTMDWHEFTSHGVSLIAEALKVNNTLHTLILDFNSLDLSAFRALGEALKVNTTLHTLSLESLGVLEGDREDFLVFCDALKTNTTLRSLNLDSTYLHEDCYEALQEALKVNRGLVEVYQPTKEVRPLKKIRKQKKAEDIDASNIEEAGAKAAENNGQSEVLKSEDEEAKSPFTELSTRPAKLTAQANITPVVAKKTRKKRNAQENGDNNEAKNSNETKIQEDVKAENETSKEDIKEPITKKAKDSKKAANNAKNKLNKGFGIIRRKQRRAKLFAQSMIRPVMERKTRKRKSGAQNDNNDENSKSEEKSAVESPTKLQRKAKLIASENIKPLLLKRPRNKNKSAEEANKKKNDTNTKKKKNTAGAKEVKSTKPKKYIKKKDIKLDLSTNNTPKKLAIKVPPNQRRAKYFAKANITPLMIRNTRKRRKSENESKNDEKEENGANNNQRKAKLVARRSITPVVIKKTRERRKSDEESKEIASPSKKAPEEIVKRGRGRPPKKRRRKNESTPNPGQEVKDTAPFQPKRQFRFKVIKYQPKRKAAAANEERKLNWNSKADGCR